MDKESPMQLTFLGAAETVTGSRLFVQTSSSRVLVDCGLFQGLKRLRELNWSRFAVNPASIDAVILTHAHIDHSGYLPALVRDGFRGPIWCTPGTEALARILLPDAAHLQEEEARYANERGSSRHHPARPLYTTDDARRCLDQFRAQPVGVPFEPAPQVEVAFTPAGHIIGAASARLSDGRSSVLVSGDLGRRDDPIMLPPAPPPESDLVVIESTYGDRRHPPEDAESVLADVVNRTVHRGGIVLIPVFAVGRAQTVLHLLARLRTAGRIPDVPTYLNSPMAAHATEAFLRCTDEHRLGPADLDELSRGVTLVRTVDESKALTSRHGPMIVLTASGMLTGGRVLHHLEQVAPDHRSTIVLAGFQAAGTRGEALAHGARTLRVFGEDIPVRAHVVQLESLSAHADADELIGWLRAAPRPPAEVRVVHGEPIAAETLRRRIEHELGWHAVVATMGDHAVCRSAARAPVASR
ncbi:MAG TPA: MBL fold metallo-hydrolase [Ilumatobacteraceae bacterium]